MTITLHLAYALLGGLIYRIRGGLFNFGYIEVWRAVFISCYTVSLINSGHYLAAIAVLPFLMIGVSLGHGNFQDMGTWTKPTSPERIEVLFSWLKPHVSPFWYDYIGMTLSGLILTIPAGIAMGSSVIAVSGAMKAVAYTIGWKCKFKRPTEIGEFLTGVFLWGAI